MWVSTAFSVFIRTSASAMQRLGVLAVLSVATVASQFYFAASTLCRFLRFVQYLHPCPTLRRQTFGHSGSQGHHL